jgi:hypothetical protein
MVDETSTILDRWSRHGAHGVNALVQDLPRLKMRDDGTIGPDEWPAPATATLFLDLEDKGTAAELDPPKLPAFCTWGEGNPTQVDLNDAHFKGRAYAVLVGTAYVTKVGVDADMATRTAGMFLRANRISFRRFNTQDLSNAFRELNDIRVLKLEHVASQKVPGLPVGASLLWGFNITRAFVVDRLT